jgi:hypothetical protein
MASSVALINKDIARHYQLKNLLTPPEAIELTKLYNEMSDILSKPVKFRNNPTQLHLFYDLLSQYAKHFENVKLDGAPIQISKKPEDKKAPDIQPVGQTPIVPEQDIDTDTGNMSEFVDASEADQTMLPAQPLGASTPHSSTAVVPYSQPTPKTATPNIRHAQSVKVSEQTPIRGTLKMLGIDKNIETPKKVIEILKKHDRTFKFYDDAKTIIIQGHQFSSQEFLKLLEQLRNPNFKQDPTHPTSDVLLYTIAQYTQNETEGAKRKLFKQLPGLEKYILAQPSGTRASSKLSTAKKLNLDDTAVTTQATAKPTKLPSSKSKEGHGRSKKPLTIVHWARWQKHLKRFVFSLHSTFMRVTSSVLNRRQLTFFPPFFLLSSPYTETDLDNRET